MKFQDWHTHNLLCRHAIGTLEDYVKMSIELDLDIIGLSDHFPFEYLEGVERLPIDEYSMTLDEIEKYISNLETLREEYKDQIKIRIGFEADFVENQIFNLNVHLNKIKSRLDYILGSIHILYSNNGPFGMDDSRFLDEYNSLGTDNVYLMYFQTMQKMLNTKEFDFDIVSHLDLPKKFNKIPENKEIVSNEVIKSLELIKKRGKTVEINTGGLRKEIKEQYPSEDIIKLLYELDIPVLLGSDSHKPSELAYEFKKMITILKNIGYNQLASFNNRKRSFIEI